MNRVIVTFIVFLSLFFGSYVAAETIGASGQKLPRFVSLRADKANLRTGPGSDYPIEWTYTRRFLPLEIIEEHGPWRKVRDHENTEGWMHRVLLLGPRTAMVRGRVRKLYAEDDLSSPVLLTAEEGVIGEVVECASIWCRLKINGTKAWIERRHIWGVYNNEILD